MYATPRSPPRRRGEGRSHGRSRRERIPRLRGNLVSRASVQDRELQLTRKHWAAGCRRFERGFCLQGPPIQSRSPPSRVWAHVPMCFNRNMSMDQIRSDDAVLSMDFSIVASRTSLMSSLSSSLTYSATFFSRRASVLAAAARAKVATASRVKVATARVKAAAVRATERAKAAAVRAAARRKAPRARGDVAAARAKTGATRGTVVRR